VSIFEIERRGIDAIAKPAGLRSVVENVAQMCAAAATDDFLPNHAMTGIADGPDVLAGER
jgi:hypothetical protein